MKKIFCFLTIACCFLLTTTAKAQESNMPSQDLSMSVGKTTFFKLTDSKRTKPNFIDIGLDKLLQKFLAATAQEGVTFDYSFLEFLPAEKSIILTNLKINSKQSRLQGGISFGSFKIGLQDFLKSMQQHSLSFSQVNAENVKLDITVFANKKAKEKINAAAKTVQLSDAVLGPCSRQEAFLEMMKGVPFVETEAVKTTEETPTVIKKVDPNEGRCLTAMRVFVENGYLNRSLHKEKYVVRDGLINGFYLKLDTAENPLIFSIGQVNDKTVRTMQELFNVLKQ